MTDGLRLGLSFLVGGAWVAAATAAAERSGSRLGGFIGGLPSTVAVALFFVAWTEGAPVAAASAAVVPLAFAVNAWFLLLFAAGLRRGFRFGFTLALGVWALLQAALVRVGPVPPGWAAGFWLLTLGLCHWGFRHGLRIQFTPPGGARGTGRDLALRAVASGLLVMAAVAASRRWGAAAGGVLASVPVVFLSTLVIVNRSQGTEFARSLARSLLFSAVIHCSVFAVAFHYAIQRVEPLAALALAYAATALLALPVYRARLG